jgi:hypothetical protein
MKHNKANPTIPKTGLGRRNNEACHDSIIGPQEIKGLILHDGMWLGLTNNSIFSKVIIAAAMNDNKLAIKIAILLFL